MKRILILIVTLLIAYTSFSQEYHKFPTSDAIWNYLVTGSMVPPYEWLVIDSLGQEITIDNKQYIEVYKAAHGNSYVIGAIREDTIQKKVYFHNFMNEIILYDFTIEVGDTIHYTTNLYYTLDYYKVVEAIDSTLINGQYRKTWFLTNSYLIMPDIWIEGIGSVYRYGLLYPNDPDIVLDASTPYFGCFKDGTITYLDSNNCCSGECPCSIWLVNTSELDTKADDISIFPNPAQNKLTLDFGSDNPPYDYCDLYTFNALLIQKFEIKSRKIEINISSLDDGIYFIKLTGQNNSTVKRFIKN